MNKIFLICVLCFGLLQNTKAQTPDTIAAPKEIITKQPPALQTETDDEGMIFTKCEITPSYPGGEVAWKKYIADNAKLINYLNCGTGNYNIMVNFIVDKKGAASSIRVENGTRCGLEKEAIRLIQSVPKWTPGMQNGTVVKAVLRLPVPITIY